MCKLDERWLCVKTRYACATESPSCLPTYFNVCQLMSNVQVTCVNVCIFTSQIQSMQILKKNLYDIYPTIEKTLGYRQNM